MDVLSPTKHAKAISQTAEVVYETASKVAIAPFFCGSSLVAMDACMHAKVDETENRAIADVIVVALAIYDVLDVEVPTEIGIVFQRSVRAA